MAHYRGDKAYSLYPGYLIPYRGKKKASRKIAEYRHYIIVSIMFNLLNKNLLDRELLQKM